MENEFLEMIKDKEYLCPKGKVSKFKVQNLKFQISKKKKGVIFSLNVKIFKSHASICKLGAFVHASFLFFFKEIVIFSKNKNKKSSSIEVPKKSCINLHTRIIHLCPIQVLTRISPNHQSHQMRRLKSGCTWVIQINPCFSCKKSSKDKSSWINLQKTNLCEQIFKRNISMNKFLKDKPP